MAIVKMRHVRLMAMRQDRDELLRLFQRMGCVEIDEPPEPPGEAAWAALVRPDTQGLEQARARQSDLERALSTLKKYAPEKGGLLRRRPRLTEQEFWDQEAYDGALTVAGQINAAQRDLGALYAVQSRLTAQKAALAPWSGLDLPLETDRVGEVLVELGTTPAAGDDGLEAALQAATSLQQLRQVGADRSLRYWVLLYHQSAETEVDQTLKEHSWSRVALREWRGTAADNLAALDRQLAEWSARAETLTEQIRALAPSRPALYQALDRTGREIEREQAKGRLLETGAVFCLEGWVPAEREEALARRLGDYLCAWECADPVPEEYPQVPVQLKNNRLTRSMGMVTQMYGLPAYDGVDPNPLMWPFFVFFFGFMFADFGYGLLMILFALVVKWRARPKGSMGSMMDLVLQCGVSTAVIGFLTGGFFANSIVTVSALVGEPTPAIPFLTYGAVIDIMTQPLEVLILTLGIGLVQIVTGMAVSVYMKARQGQWMDALCNEVAWWVVFVCIGLSAGTGNWNVMLVAAVVLVLTQSYGKKGIIGKLVGIIASLYNNVTGYFGDILSYSRLMVMMLAGSVIGQVFNLLGSMAGSLLVFIPVFLVGHAFNMGLNIIGTYVHTSRLQYLEFFKTFYKEGGRPFRPLSYENTKYVDIIKEEV